MSLAVVGIVPTFSDLEVVALSITAEALSIDSENNLKVEHRMFWSHPNLIMR